MRSQVQVLHRPPPLTRLFVRPHPPRDLHGVLEVGLLSARDPLEDRPYAGAEMSTPPPTESREEALVTKGLRQLLEHSPRIGHARRAPRPPTAHPARRRDPTGYRRRVRGGGTRHGGRSPDPGIRTPGHQDATVG